MTTKAKPPRLRGCPHCGYEPPLILDTHVRFDHVFWVTCPTACDEAGKPTKGCGASGPSKLGEPAAIAAWNTRAKENK